ncbi:MAG TPA: hypothetical protein VL404_07425 [Candidatus Eisenbacteria bacterium]|jgi:hypothetical protein|nr:hypothetical protein [Candidatus Eisenbacteria bacterium]
MDKLDRQLKEFIAARRFTGARRPQAPSVEDYLLYLEGALEGEPLERMLDHLKTDAEARHLIIEARALLEGGAEARHEAVPAGALERARSLGRKKSPLRRQGLLTAIWLGIAAVSFAASFFVPRYYMQFLVLTVLFGFKGILDARQLKTQILIYKTLTEETPANGHLQNARPRL